MQGKLFQRFTHLLYCSVLSMGGNVNTRRTSKPDIGSIFHIKNQWNILVIGNYYLNSMLSTFSDTKRTLMHLFLFTNSTQKELVSICTQCIRNCNKLSLHYILGCTRQNVIIPATQLTIQRSGKFFSTSTLKFKCFIGRYFVPWISFQVSKALVQIINDVFRSKRMRMYKLENRGSSKNKPDTTLEIIN